MCGVFVLVAVLVALMCVLCRNMYKARLQKSGALLQFKANIMAVLKLVPDPDNKTTNWCEIK